MTARRSFPAFLLVVLAFLAAPLASGQVSLTTLGTPYTQNFDTLPSSGSATWTNNSNIPGWFHARTGTGTTVVANNGSSNAGNLYSYGCTDALAPCNVAPNSTTDRALGSVGSGNAAIGNLFWGVRLQNNTGSTITQLDVTYTGEQWRNSAAAAQTIAFSYLVGSPTVTGSLAEFQSAGVAVAALDFTSPITGGAAGALNGNLAANRTVKTFSITGLSIPNGTEIMLRWADPDHTGADHGLSIDDFAVTPQGAAPLPQLTVTDVSQNEGTGGSTTFTFQVNLSAPAGPGGVTFDIATADGTAEDDNPATEDNDYTPQSLTGQTIAAGNSSFAFNVTVNPDVIPEVNETFFVNVTNVTGATVTDGQGQGTIQNDDASCADLTINNVSQNETDAGTTTFAFTVSLSQAGCGTVTFDIATADGTAQDDNPVAEDNDYVGQSLTGQTVTFPGTYTFNVTVNGDMTLEPNETFFVNVTNVSPGNVTVVDDQGLGTIVNDDYTRIHDIQGPGSSSPIVGATVTTRGVVTGRKSNGYFIQEPDASVDADPATSEGIFVFTSAAPPAAAAVGNYVGGNRPGRDMLPTQDPQQPPLTEIGGSPTTVQLSTGNPLPTAVPLTPTFPNPAGPFDQLERVEGMRVSAASMTVVAPSDGSINEPNNTGTSNGRFFGVVTGVARPFREPGIRQPDVPPTGTIPPIPRWDSNPELLGIESAAINAQPVLTVKTNDTVAPIVGPLDYGFRRYAIYPDGTNTITVTPGTLPTVVSTPTARELTIATWNVFHLYDTVNVTGTGPGSGDVVVTAGTYADRMNKASIAIRNNLKFPDILGLQEVENLTVLQDLATKINNDAVTNAQPNPMYVAYLSEGNDIGGIDVGYLVKTAEVSPGLPRVTVNSVTQIGLTTMWTDPDDGNPDELNDRPSLVLDAVINRAPGASFPVIVINNHLRSLIGIDSSNPAGVTTEGDRVRRKRQIQADFLAQYIQGRLTSNPNEHIVLVGDFNAFEFNDGYVDVMNHLTGTPPPDNQTVVCSTCPTPPNTNDGVDQINPDLTNLSTTPVPSERYSYVFDGNAQTLDHVVVSAGMVADTTARRIERARIAADYPETERANAASPLRLTDHDPTVGYFDAIVLGLADVSLTKTDNVDPVNAGQNFFYTVTVNNAGPDAADTVSWSDALPAGTTFVSLSQPGGWTCTTPAVGANGTVTCSIVSLGVTSAAFNITVAVNAGLASGTVLSNTATVTSTTTDPNGPNGTDTETTTVGTSADLLLSKTDSPDPVNAGSNLSYQITITNNGPSNAATASWTDTLPAGTTFVSLSTTGSWTCTTPAVGATGTVTCNNTSFLVTADFFTIVVNVDPNVAAGTILTNTATVSSAITDPNGANNSDTATTTVATSADLLISKTDTPDPVTAGSNLTYTITATNAGPSDATTVSLSDTLPAGSTFVSLSQPGGWSCSTPAVGGTGTVTCTLATFPASGSGVFTLVVNVGASTATGTILSNTATITTATPDNNGSNNSATATTTVGVGSADVRILKDDTPISSDPINAGEPVVYTIIVNNDGPSAAADVSWSDTLPAGTTFLALHGEAVPNPVPAGWTCTTPAVGATGTVTCSIASLGITTSSPRIFTLILDTDPSLAAGTVLSNTVTVSSATSDPNGANNSSTETTTLNNSADVQVTKSDSPDPVTAGTNITYAINVTNAGPSNAASVALADTLPTGTTFEFLSAPAGWTCTTPSIGGTGTVNCSIASLTAGTVASFSLVVHANPGLGDGTVITNTASVSSATPDVNSSNNNATAITTIGIGSADLAVTKTDTPDPVNAGANLTYTITVTNAGPTNAASASLSDTLPANTTFVSLASPAGWTCITPAAGATGTVTCTNPSVATGSSIFTLVVNVNGTTAPGTVLSNTATVSTTTADPSTGNESATTTTTVVSPANVTGTKTVSGSFVPGTNITYTIVLSNSGPAPQQNNPGDELTDVLPPSLILVSATANSGTAVANVGTNTVTWNGSIPAGGSVTINITATIRPDIAPGTTINNQGTIAYDADGNGTNESTRQTDSPSAPGGADATSFVVGDSHLAKVPTLDQWALIALAAAMAAFAALKLRA